MCSLDMGMRAMDKINTIIDQWHEQIGPLQQKAVESRATYLAARYKLESLKSPPAPEGNLAVRAAGYLRNAFTFAFRAPALHHKTEIARLGMQREQFQLDRFITETTSQLAASLSPALEITSPDDAPRMRHLQAALDSGLQARQKSDIAALSCAQAANNIQWANNRYYFNALQRCQNSARSLQDAVNAIGGFNDALIAAGHSAKFDSVSDVSFSKFGPEFSGINTAKFNEARRRLEGQRQELSGAVNDLRADLLDSLSAAADKLGVKTKAFDSMIQAAHQRLRPPAATITGAAPKADF